MAADRSADNESTRLRKQVQSYKYHDLGEELWLAFLAEFLPLSHVRPVKTTWCGGRCIPLTMSVQEAFNYFRTQIIHTHTDTHAHTVPPGVWLCFPRHLSEHPGSSLLCRHSWSQCDCLMRKSTEIPNCGHKGLTLVSKPTCLWRLEMHEDLKSEFTL